MEHPVIPLGRNLYGHPLTNLLWERHFEKVPFEHGWEKSSKLGTLICKLRKRTILVCVCPNVESIFERSRFGRANIHGSLTMLIWVALKESAKRAKILCTITEICLNPGSLEELKKSCLVQGNLTQTSLHGPMIWKVMQSYVLSDITSLRTKLRHDQCKYGLNTSISDLSILVCINTMISDRDQQIRMLFLIQQVRMLFLTQQVELASHGCVRQEIARVKQKSHCYQSTR